MNTVVVSCPSCLKKNRFPAGKQHLRPKCGQCGTPIDMTGRMVPVELGDNDFHDFVKAAPLPVMVDFFSPTCGPCRMMSPVVEAMARDHGTSSIIAKVDTSKNQRIALLFNIRGVPTFLFFKNGSLIDQVSGAVARDVLERKLKSA